MSGIFSNMLGGIANREERSHMHQESSQTGLKGSISSQSIKYVNKSVRQRERDLNTSIRDSNLSERFQVS